VGDSRHHLKAKLSALELGLEGLVRRIDQLNDAEVERISRELDQLSPRYAKLLNLPGRRYPG
jgi:hypothetical protein